MDVWVTGTLKTKHSDKGFGHIQRTDGDGDVFVHRSCFPRPGDWDALREGAAIELTIMPEEEKRPEHRGKGPRAKEVRVLAAS